MRRIPGAAAALVRSTAGIRQNWGVAAVWVVDGGDRDQGGAMAASGYEGALRTRFANQPDRTSLNIKPDTAG